MRSGPLAPWLCLLLGGCPFIVGPPDYRNVEPSEDRTTDPTPTGDSAPTDRPTESDTGTEPPDSIPVVTVEAVVTATSQELHLQITDADGDVVGGSVVWSDSAATSKPLTIPDDLTEWNGLTGEAVVVIGDAPADCAARAIDRSFAVQVTDEQGHVSSTAEATLSLAVHDAGSPPNPGRRDLGEITAPALLCGNLVQGDRHARWGTTHEPGGTWSIRFTYQGSPGVDLTIGGPGINTSLTSGQSPQSATGLALKAGEAVDFDIDRRSTDTAPVASYQVLIHH